MHPQPAMHVQDDSPLGQLYRLHAPTIFAYLRMHTPSREDAEDLLLEVFLAAIEYELLIERDEQAQRAWLRSVAHHKLVDRYRRTKNHQFVNLEHIADSLYDEDDHSPEQQALRKEASAEVFAALKQLSPLQQHVVYLHFVYGLRCAEIATVLDKKEGAIRMLLSRALHLLRTFFEKA